MSKLFAEEKLTSRMWITSNSDCLQHQTHKKWTVGVLSTGMSDYLSFGPSVKYGLFAACITPTSMKKTSNKPGLVLLPNKVITIEIRVYTLLLLLPTKFFLKPAKATPKNLVLSY